MGFLIVNTISFLKWSQLTSPYTTRKWLFFNYFIVYIYVKSLHNLFSIFKHRDGWCPEKTPMSTGHYELKFLLTLSIRIDHSPRLLVIIRFTISLFFVISLLIIAYLAVRIKN